jgi:hypothetical protein
VSKNVDGMKILFVVSLLAASLTAHALPRKSADYTLSPETGRADQHPSP